MTASRQKPFAVRGGAPPATAGRVAVGDRVGRALAFLSRRQLPWGEFRADRYSNPRLRGRGRRDGGIFGTTVVLQALAGVKDPRAGLPMRRGLAFLLEEREEDGLWRYWSSRNPASIPADVDDTACAGHLIRTLRPEAADPASRMAVLNNRDPEGCFRTWFLPPDHPNDVDAVVNANALLFVGECDAPAAAEAVADRIVAGREGRWSWYYVDALSLFYAVSRAWRLGGVTRLGACREAILERTLARRKPDGSFGDELATALALSTLGRLEGASRPVLEETADFLLRAQRRDGSWPARAYYAGPAAPAPHRVWWGSPEITTALCVEALAGLS